jgi:ABC-type multidrug transport system fused ATPase/permease subunit
VLWSVTIVLFAGATAFVFGAGSRLFEEGALTIGSVYLIFHYTEMMRQPIERIRMQMEDLQKAGAGIDRVQELFATTSVLDRSGAGLLPDGPLSVDFEAVTFTYEGPDNGDDPALHELSFHMEPGRVLGVLGRSGSGKTTLARLLTRLYDPDAGQVRVGEVPLRDADVTDLRRGIGMVTQDVQLFSASIRDNLTFFDRSVPEGQILEVLDALGFADWVASRPQGLDTPLGKEGGVSAGEAQLLAFTRIFLEDPGVVILDEASSRLDPATEQLIERAVDRLLENRTGIIIAHRLATVERADDILIMEDGKAVEFGDRLILAEDPGSRFSRLLRTGIEEVLQ